MMVFKTQMHIFTSSQALTELRWFMWLSEMLDTLKTALPLEVTSSTLRLDK